MAKSFSRRLLAEMDAQDIDILAVLDLYGALALLFDDMDAIQVGALELDGLRPRGTVGEQATASDLVVSFRASVMYFLETLLPLWDDEEGDEPQFVHPETEGHLEGIRTEAKAQILRLAQFVEREVKGQVDDMYTEHLWAASSLAELDPHAEVEELTDDIVRKLRGDDSLG